MRFRFSDEQEMLRRTVRAFAAQELKPAYLRELDASGRAPHGELLPRMAALGFTALPVHAEYGGVGGSFVDAAVLLEELGRASLAVAAVLNSAIGFGCEAVRRHGSEAQKRELLPQVVRAEMCFASALTEPDAVFDPAALRTRARRDADGFVIDGAGMLITGAAECRCLIVAARIEIPVAGERVLGLFALDPHTPGITRRPIEKLGMRAAGGLYEVDYDEVRVRDSALLRLPDGGWDAIEALLERDRVLQAASCIGCAQQVIDDAVRYAGERQQFGQPIGKFQAIAHLLADLQVEVDAARWLLYRAAWTVDTGARCASECAMAHLACTEALLKATSDAMRVYGGYGLTLEFDIQRHFRDARLFAAGDGAGQARRGSIARSMGLAS